MLTGSWLRAAVVAWALAAASYGALRLNFERAPAVHVRWSAAVDAPARAGLERQFALADGTYDSGQTWVYLLTSPTPANIQALVQSPAIEDTHHIDRQQFRVSADAPRRGPYIGRGPAWIPAALLALSSACAIAGSLALGVALAPALTPHLASLSIAAVLVGLWVAYFVQLRTGATDAAGFRVGDWLVSYEPGFTRRGLLGWPIIRATSAFGTAPETIVLWIQAALYALLFALLFLLLYRKRPNVWFLAFLFSPAALLFPLYDEAVIGRKDVLFFVAFALYAWWMSRGSSGVPCQARHWTGAVAFMLGAATTLAHEMFFFFTPYFFVMRLLQASTRGVRLQADPRPFIPELSLFAGALVALLLVVSIGADLRGDAQCAALLARGFDEDLCTGIMRYPATTIAESIRETAVTVRHAGYLWAYPIAAALAVLPLLPLFASIAQRVPRAAVVGVIAAVAFTMPLFVTVLDWGRLLNIHVMAIAVLIVAFLLDDRETSGSAFGVNTAWLRIAALLIIGLYLTGWSVRHCCEAPLGGGLIG